MQPRTDELPKYVETTRNVQVTVSPEFLHESSSFDEQQYSFAYHIRIDNQGSETVQLLERHWKIFSAGVQIGEVIGPGVVGYQPTLKAGQHFEYTSGAVIKDAIGYMEGTYTFRSADGKLFEVLIPRFHLLYPSAIH